jgi:hypothetical protein
MSFTSLRFADDPTGAGTASRVSWYWGSDTPCTSMACRGDAFMLDSISACPFASIMLRSILGGMTYLYKCSSPSDIWVPLPYTQQSMI